MNGGNMSKHIKLSEVKKNLESMNQLAAEDLQKIKGGKIMPLYGLPLYGFPLYGIPLYGLPPW